MEYNFDEWKKALEDFRRSVSQDLEEIRRHKEEVRQIKADIFSARNSGYFLRDDNRIVLSAPEIIIGNVDRDGVLADKAGSVVVIRAKGIDLDGAGENGHIQSRAASIRQIAVNPGIDGQEAVVGPLSEVVSQARCISLDAHSDSGVFSRTPASPGEGSVRIHADASLLAEASVSADEQSKRLETLIKQLEEQKKTVEKEADGNINSFGSLSQSIKAVYDHQESLLSDLMSVRSDTDSLAGLEEQMQQYSAALSYAYEASARSLSRLAEINRQITCLKKAKDGLKKPDAFKKSFTGAAVSIVGERVNLVSRDGDGNLRDNEDAGISLLANRVEVKALDKDGALQKEGKVRINAKTVEVSTVNSQEQKYDDKGKLQSGTYPAEGDVLVRSKTVSVEAVDQEFKDGKMQEKALTKDSALSIRIEKADVSATDTEGKATGSIAFNAKEVAIRSMNVDKEKRTDDKLAEGSTMLLLSEKMFVGAKKKDIKSKKVQVVTEEAGLFADKTLELQQGDAQAVLQLEGGKAALSGSETQVYGKTTLNGKTEVKDELKAPKATIEHVEAKTSFKSSNISDGIPVPPPPSTAKLSAKLKAEDAPEKK